MEYQALQIDEWKGLTDEPSTKIVGALFKADNIWLLSDRTARIRPGSVLFNTTSLGSRIEALLPSVDTSTENFLHKISNGKLFYETVGGGASIECLGPENTSMFSSSAQCAYSVWNNHAIITGLS